MSSLGRNDPLAGKRDAINRSEVKSLMWPDTGEGCPVAVGDIFQLRSCQIEITRTHHLNKLEGRMWRAEFKRIHSDKVHLLGRRGGHTSDPDLAMRAQDDPQAATIDAMDWRDRDEAHRALGPAPEPEGLPLHEIGELPSSIAAQERYRKLHSGDIEKRIDRSLTSKLREVRIRARQTGVDVSEEMEVIEEATEKARLKVKRVA